MKHKKAQAAVEFLMTYGWMIIVVVVAIAALAYFGVFDVSKNRPSKCTADGGMFCSGTSVGTYSVTVVFINNLQKDIIIKNITTDACISGDSWVCLGTSCNKTLFDHNLILKNDQTATIKTLCTNAIVERDESILTLDYTNFDSTFLHKHKITVDAKPLNETRLPCPVPPYDLCSITQSYCNGIPHNEYYRCCEGICTGNRFDRLLALE